MGKLGGHQTTLPEIWRAALSRMVKELDLFESNNGCGMNGLSNGPCRRTRQHRWG